MGRLVSGKLCGMGCLHPGGNTFNGHDLSGLVDIRGTIYSGDISGDKGDIGGMRWSHVYSYEHWHTFDEI